MTERSCPENEDVNDIVARLNDHALFSKQQRMELFKEAAAEIEHLRLEHRHACQEIAVATAERDGLRTAAQTTFTPGDPVEVRKQNDEIDEIVIRCGDVHIEQMDASSWFLGVNASDGSYHQFWFGAKNGKSHVHFRHTETSPAATSSLSSTESK